MIDGLKTKIAFEVTDGNGNYLDFMGELVLEQSGITIPIKTLYKGMGYLQMVPSHSEEYHIRASENSSPINYQFPQVIPVGGLISASTKLDEVIKISVQFNEASSAYRLLGHADGVVFCDHKFYNRKEVFLFNKKYVPTGVLHFTLFNEANKPIAERLVFNDYNYHNDLLEVEPWTSFFRKKSKVNIDISSVQWNENDSMAYVSISVTDDNLYNPSITSHDIISEWYINNRLDFLIPELPQLLSNIGHKERFLMDLYMMVRGWRRFHWDNLHQHDDSLNQGVNIRGIVENHQSDIKVVVSNFSNPFFYDEQDVTWGPSFSFNSIPITNGSSFILQLKDKDNDQLVKIDKGKILLDSLKPSMIESRLKLQYHSTLDTTHQSFLENSINKLKQDSLLEFSFNVDLEEVLIKEKRERDVRRFGLNDISKIDWIDPKTPSRNLISRMRPSARVLNSATGRLQFEMINDQGFNERVNAVIVIDGTLHYDGTRYLNLAKFNSLTADQILYFGVNPPVITIYTNPDGPRSLQNQKSNIYTYLLPGVDDYKEFYRPVYEIGDPNLDFRTTIHWEPNIILKKGSKANVNFYSGDEDANYTYVIQGMTSTGTPIFKNGKLVIKD